MVFRDTHRHPAQHDIEAVRDVSRRNGRASGRFERRVLLREVGPIRLDGRATPAPSSPREDARAQQGTMTGIFGNVA